MSDISSKWNERYADSEYSLPAVAKVLVQGERWLPGAAETRSTLAALDLACGRASNGEWLGQRGFHVSAWDISENAIADIRQRPASRVAVALVRDLEKQPPLPCSFDVITVCRFLDRALCPAICEALKPGGVLFYQTFSHGLSNPDFLLKSNELLSLFASLSILEYHEPEPDDSGKAEAWLIARRQD